MKTIYYVRYEEVPKEEAALLLPRGHTMKRESRFATKKEALDFMRWLHERQLDFPSHTLIEVTENVMEKWPND